jgi:cytochrome c oxidase cbb3-type subunit III
MSQEPKRGHFAQHEGEIVLREHEYDGIQEYDQKLPNWWLFTFYGAVVWFLAYWVLYYHTGLLKTDHEKVREGIVAVRKIQEAELEKALANLNDGVIVHQWATDPTLVAAGAATYQIHCIACHAADFSATMKVGETVIPLPGLPLNDGEWKFGGKPMDIFKLVNEGSPPESEGLNGAKMQVFGQLLSPKEIAQVVAYLVHSMPEEFKDIPEP